MPTITDLQTQLDAERNAHKLVMDEVDRMETEASNQKRDLSNDELASMKDKVAEADERLSKINSLSDQIKTLQTIAKNREFMNGTTREVPALQLADNKTSKSPASTRNEYLMSQWRSYLTCGDSRTFSASARRDLSQGTDSAGGYLNAPAIWSENLIKTLDNVLFVRDKANVLPPLKGSDTQGFPVLADDPADSDWQSSEVADISAQNDTTMDFSQRLLIPAMLTKYLKVSRKLLTISNYPVESLIQQRLLYKLRVTLEKAYMTGQNSNNQPFGLFYGSASGIPTSQDVTTAAAATITDTDILSVFSKISPQYWNELEWVCHPNRVLDLRGIKDGNGRSMWEPGNGGIVNGFPGTLYGLPVRVSSYAPSTTTTGIYALALVHWPSYYIIDHANIEVDRLDELFRMTNQVAYITNFYSTGAPVVSTAFARLKFL